MYTVSTLKNSWKSAVNGGRICLNRGAGEAGFVVVLDTAKTVTLQHLGRVRGLESRTSLDCRHNLAPAKRVNCCTYLWESGGIRQPSK